MHTIVEHELIDNLAHHAVKRMRLVQVERGFRITVELGWKEGQILLVTQRKKPKEWASLDRLVRHINVNYATVPVITLHLGSKSSGSMDHPSDEQHNPEAGHASR
jgi:hypothetical protein